MAAGQSRGIAASSNTMGVGIITAAAVVLILAGVMHAMQGVVGLATNEFYVVTSDGCSNSTSLPGGGCTFSSV